ncbi:MAG TPA: hypothetical protein VFV39_06450 [Limnobacter sp.]|nr:hypothetical protein [Limnobacter sp.]
MTKAAVTAGTGLTDNNMTAESLDGKFDSNMSTRLSAISAAGDSFYEIAINEFLGVVSGQGVSTGQVIAAAAKLKQSLGAGKAYYDVISTLGDDLKRLISDAVK